MAFTDMTMKTIQKLRLAESEAAAHTPGKWAVVETDTATFVQGDHRNVAGLYGGTLWAPEQERHANARLIAAAPELAEALRDCVGFLDDMSEDYSDYGIPAMAAKAHAALAKVEGREG